MTFYSRKNFEVGIIKYKNFFFNLGLETSISLNIRKMFLKKKTFFLE